MGFAILDRSTSGVAAHDDGLRRGEFCAAVLTRSEFTFLHLLSPILGIGPVKIPAETLKQRTILFKLIDVACNWFHLFRENHFYLKGAN
jgi:hypothetical protein